MRKKVTLVDIAKETGFSVNCVSRALMDAPDISQSTKNIIRGVADELGYIPNLNAASLKKGNSKIIGVLYDNILNHYYNTMIFYLHDILKKRGYSIIIYQSNSFDENIYKEMVSRNIEGVISFLVPNEKVVKLIKNSRFNSIIVGRRSEYISSIYYDDYKVGYIAANTLIDKGFKKPIYLGENEELEISKERARGFITALTERKLDGKVFYRNEPISVEQKLELILKDNEVDSIFCFSDMFAFEVLKVLNKRKLKSVKVIGVDNIQAEVQLPFTLTTIGHDKAKMANDVVDLLFSQINDTNNETKFIVEDVYLVE